MTTDCRGDLDVALRGISQFWHTRDPDCLGYFAECAGASVVRDSSVKVRRRNLAPLDGYMNIIELQHEKTYVESNHHTLIDGDSALHEFDWEIRYRAYPHHTSAWWPVFIFITYREDQPLARHEERGHSSMSLFWSTTQDRWQVCWMTTVNHSSSDWMHRTR